MDTQDNTNPAQPTLEGYEGREVVWPGTDERFVALFPKTDSYSLEA